MLEYISESSLRSGCFSRDLHNFSSSALSGVKLICNILYHTVKATSNLIGRDADAKTSMLKKTATRENKF